MDFCRANDISAIVKGLRAVSDFEYEMEMAQMNYRLAEVETLFIAANPVYTLPAVQPGQGDRQYGGDVSSLVPGACAGAAQEPAGGGPAESAGDPAAAAVDRAPLKLGIGGRPVG